MSKIQYKKLSMLLIICIISIILFLLYDMNYTIFSYAISKRIVKVFSIMLVGTAIGLSTLTFQVITGNRILTPAVMGMDSLYTLFQLVIIIFFGTFSSISLNPYTNFIISAILMVTFSVLLYKLVFSKTKSIFFMVLIGVVIGTFLDSINGMLQIIISPDVFNMILDKLFANFNNVNTDLLGLSSVLIIIFTIFLVKKRHVLDVLSLGKDTSINLGLNYNKEVMQLLIVVFILVSISTALVGPITFLGFFAVNISKNYIKNYQHIYLMLATCMVSIIVLNIGQFIVEHIFDFGLPVSIIINLVGGAYFIFTLLKENT